MYIFSPISNVEFGIPRISKRVRRSSPIAVIIIPSLPRTVDDFPLELNLKHMRIPHIF